MKKTILAIVAAATIALAGPALADRDGGGRDRGGGGMGKWDGGGGAGRHIQRPGQDGGRHIQRPDFRRPDVRRPDIRKPDVRRPDVRRPDHRWPDVKRPDRDDGRDRVRRPSDRDWNKYDHNWRGKRHDFDRHDRRFYDRSHHWRGHYLYWWPWWVYDDPCLYAENQWRITGEPYWYDRWIECLGY